MHNTETIVKHWAGIINYNNMTAHPFWFDNWKQKAKEAKEAGNDLVVFKIPQGKAGLIQGGLIEEIELLIQSKCQ